MVFLSPSVLFIINFFLYISLRFSFLQNFLFEALLFGQFLNAICLISLLYIINFSFYNSLILFFWCAFCWTQSSFMLMRRCWKILGPTKNLFEKYLYALVNQILVNGSDWELFSKSLYIFPYWISNLFFTILVILSHLDKNLCQSERTCFSIAQRSLDYLIIHLF